MSFRKLICSITILVISSPLLSQKMPSDYFNEGVIFERNDDLNNSLASFEYIINNHPKNGYYASSYYNAALILYKKKDYTESLLRFKNILKGNFNELEPRGGDIMSDPYTNYRHWSSVYISNIFYDQQQYDSALYYFSLSDTLYDYQHFCGNAIEGYGIMSAMRYADIYKKLNQPDSAIKALLKYSFANLNSNNEIIDELKKLLSPKAKTIDLRKELDKGIALARKNENKPGYAHDDEYVFDFLGYEMKIEADYFYRSFEEKSPKQKEIPKLLKTTDFYKMIASLK